MFGQRLVLAPFRGIQEHQYMSYIKPETKIIVLYKLVFDTKILCFVSDQEPNPLGGSKTYFLKNYIAKIKNLGNSNVHYLLTHWSHFWL